jgi:hypothetical protein
MCQAYGSRKLHILEGVEPESRPFVSHTISRERGYKWHLPTSLLCSNPPNRISMAGLLTLINSETQEPPMPDFNLKQASTRDLLTFFANVIEELRRREVVRSGNNPLADYCESLVVRALKLKQLKGSNKGCDALDESTGDRYEIKGRRITKHRSPTQLSAFRDLDSCHFNYMVGVLFDDDFTVSRACCVPWQVVRQCAKHRKHVNGWIMHLRPSVWEQPGVRDITIELKKAQNEWL